MRLFLLFTVFGIWQSLNIKILAWRTSFDGELNITPIKNDCSTERPIATYSFNRGETIGVLYAASCRDGSKLPSPLVDRVKYQFIDTAGSNPERCYGIVDTSTPSGNQELDIAGSI